MLKNYFKTATRNLSKNTFFTTLHVFGLALGMSLNLVYVAMIVFICQFDNFHPNKEHIYRVITHVRDRHENPSFASVPIGAAQLLKGNFTGVEKVVRIHRSLPHHVRYAENEIPVSGYFVDAAYLSMFNFPLLQGKPAGWLNNDWEAGQPLREISIAHNTLYEEDNLLICYYQPVIVSFLP